MESFSINLNQMAERGGRFKRYLIILGIVFIAIATISFLILYRKGNPMEWIFVAFGVYALAFFYFAYMGYKTKIFINGDEHALEYQFGFFKKVPDKVIWQTISKVKLGPTYLAFYKRTGKRKVIQIGWLPYAKVKEIKSKVHEVCIEKNIQVEEADFQKV
jgi:uncharacterized membrane protein YdbT with pleckstrin-like domain